LVAQFTTQTIQRLSVMGVPVHVLADYPDWLLTRLANRQGSHVITLNSEMAMQAEATPELAKVMQQAELIVPDGAGVVLYLRLFGFKVKRCPGIELSESLLKKAAEATPPLSVFFYGGAPGVTELAKRKWQSKLPSLNVIGTEHGFHPPEAEAEILERLAKLKPDIIFVALGVPRQEYWIAQHRSACPQAIWVGVGGSFDVWTGQKNRAPGWLRDNNLEWVYRLYQEPWRWRRMLALPQFAYRAIKERLTQGLSSS
jgi:N-acetylglucosaminyldiphosphoundecaprenol N-acetyl-beta-D-mannosaminyltransferase